MTWGRLDLVKAERDVLERELGELRVAALAVVAAWTGYLDLSEVGSAIDALAARLEQP